MPTQIEELLRYLFDDQPSPLLGPVSTWLTSSRRFAEFAGAFKDKIRKKVRTTRDEGGLLDLQAELEAAFLLLQERTLSLEYEPEQSKGIRSPDFAVTFTTRLSFMLEVTRLRTEPKAGDSELGARLADAVMGKLRQLMPGRSNLVLVSTEAGALTEDDVRNAMRGLQQRAERKDPSLLHRDGFLKRADFFRYFQRLSEVLVRGSGSNGARSMVTWLNTQARYPLPTRVRTAVDRTLSRG